MGLTPQQAERYRRQLLLPQIGPAGQRRLLGGSVLVIGAGGLGSPCALYLAAAGVGTIGIADGDRVALGNLQRQLLYTTAELGRPKAEAAAAALELLNPAVTVRPYQTYLGREEVAALAGEYDFLIDAADGLGTKLMIADACTAAGRPCCHGGVGGWLGQVTTCLPRDGNCYRCLFGAGRQAGPPQGVLGPLCGVVGSVMAAEAVKYLTGAGELLARQVLSVDLLRGGAETIAFCKKRAGAGGRCPPGCGPTRKDE